MTDAEKHAFRLLYRKHPRELPQTPRSRKALLLNVAHDPVRQPPRVRRFLLEQSRSVGPLPPLP